MHGIGDWHAKRHHNVKKMLKHNLLIYPNSLPDEYCPKEA